MITVYGTAAKSQGSIKIGSVRKIVVIFVLFVIIFAFLRRFISGRVDEKIR